MRTALLLVLAASSVTAGCAHAPPAAPAPPTQVAVPSPPRAEERIGETASPPPATSPSAPSAEDDDIREAVFRHLFARNASGQQQSAAVYCLAVEDRKDPAPPLLARFADNKPKVVPASHCKADPRTGVQEIETGARGLIFRVDTIERTGADKAVAHGGYYEAGLSASGNVYELEKEGARWVVKKDTMRWISRRGGLPGAARG